MTTMTQEEFAEIVRKAGDALAVKPMYVAKGYTPRVPAAVETVISKGAKFADPRHSFNWLPTDISGAGNETATLENAKVAIGDLVSRKF